jgi:adenylate kinase
MDAFLQDVGVLTEQDDMKEVYSFFGPPGVGKGTVAQRLVKESGYTMLSTGDLARKHISEGTDLGKTLQGYIESGGLIPDDLITQMVFEWLKDKVAQQDDPAQGSKIILDGFPRTKGQADLLLQALKEEPDFSDIKFKVVNFDLSEDEIVKRISSRLVCSNKKCQEVYSTLVKNPAKTGLCDICESPVLRRSDDEPEVVRERLRVFAGVKDDLLGFYKSVDQSVLDFKVPDGNREVVYLAFKRVLGVCN